MRTQTPTKQSSSLRNSSSNSPYTATSKSNSPNTKEWKLRENIIALSRDTTWRGAVKEWDLIDIDNLGEDDDAETCLCTHYPIKKVCIIKNNKTNAIAKVGRCCVKKFGEREFGDTHLIFDGLSRLREGGNANEALIYHAHKQGAISDQDLNFYDENKRKQLLSDRQRNWMSSIEKRILFLFQDKEEILKNICDNPKTVRTNKKTIEFLSKENVINDWEKGFYLNIWSRGEKYLSPKQKEIRTRINEKIKRFAQTRLANQQQAA